MHAHLKHGKLMNRQKKIVESIPISFQRLRDLFRGPLSSNERKATISLSASSLIPVLDANTFVNAAQDKDTDTLHKYLLAG